MPWNAPAWEDSLEWRRRLFRRWSISRISRIYLNFSSTVMILLLLYISSFSILRSSPYHNAFACRHSHSWKIGFDPYARTNHLLILFPHAVTCPNNGEEKISYYVKTRSKVKLVWWPKNILCMRVDNWNILNLISVIWYLYPEWF